MVEGVVVVVSRGAQLLLIRRAAGVAAPGAWCFVGGAIESGESQADAVRREFAEELGATVRPVGKIWEYMHPDGTLRLHWWRAELPDVPLRANPAEVAEFRWVTSAEALRLPDLLESNRAFLAACPGRWAAGAQCNQPE